MNTATIAQNSQANDLGNIKKLPILISLIIGAFFSILNETLLNIALPQLEIALKVPASTLQWLATGYMLVVGVLIPVSALLVQWFTTRQMFLGAMILFAAGTLVCGIAPSFPVLLIGRLLQAGGAGLMLPVMMNTILVLYPPEKRGAAMGSIGLVIMFAPAVGPTLSGMILQVAEWRWLFYLVLPFAVFSIIFSYMFLKNVTPVTKPKVDVLSIILSTIGFGGIVFGFSNKGEGEATWASPQVYLPLLIGGISLLIFVIKQIKSKEPMLDMRVFRFPMFSLTTVLLIIAMMTMFSTMLLLPFLMQGAFLMTTFAAGLVLLPGGLLNGLISPITGRLFDKFGPRALVIPGTVLLIVITWLFTRISMETTTITLIVLHVLLMIAIAMIMMPAQTNGLNQLPPHLYPHGTAVLNTLQQVSGAIGVALFISIMSTGQQAYIGRLTAEPTPAQLAESLLAGIHNSFMVGLGFAVFAMLLSLFIKRTQAPQGENAHASQH
ncbi:MULTISPECIES: MDR family MFS transporter [unclassified Paenibacillus]|uniref:MDR family MFS transporter n=1 Tax=unclassified Paenibacillus TaxID=185978 RepID=UPI001C0FCCEA|nr:MULTISPECIES: MDR family MFS transporter [unclassified Paenibacillus]MBU5442725.1 DHA2 family efflux MFS transporter permease subunit [Paenibacillus sp. MSJ-34]CAH0120957.1 putative multidrug resistance protein EmrY [Paenibacillus sp. CECT 9249]